MPEMPELIYDSLRQGKSLQRSLDKIAHDMESGHTRRGQSRYLFGVGAVFMLSGTLLLITRPDLGLQPAWLMGAGVLTWVVGWFKGR